MTRQPELLFQAKKLIPALTEQGFYVQRTSDAYVSGKPDLRVAKTPRQMDWELKVKSRLKGRIHTDITPLQYRTMREMNQGGMPACGLVWLSGLQRFVLTVDREIDIDSPCLTVVDGRDGIDGQAIMDAAFEYLKTVEWKRTMIWQRGT